MTISLITWNTKYRDSLSLPEKLIFKITQPIQKTVSLIAHFPIDIWENYLFISNLTEESLKLKEDIGLLRAKNNQLLETLSSYKRVDDLLKVKDTFSYASIVAYVIGGDVSLWYKTVLIDKGERDGIKKGFPVITNKGVVGKVLKVWDSSSRVLLLTDHNFAIDGIVQRNRIKGIVAGFDNSTCLFKYILATEDIRQGDTIISSGLDGLFPKGIIIGTIKKKFVDNTGVFFHVEIKPSADIKKLEEVLVIIPS
ncbi:MAG: rod shape-determining protein MreC [Thermodesulfobacteriota bacterium]|nr:rod shape-determining protein MreC [Thermodesulfobacteriota bacterium]